MKPAQDHEPVIGSLPTRTQHFQTLRHRFDGVYIANNMYTSDTVEAALVAGEVDLVSFGRPFLANPDLVERFRIGAELAEAPMEFWY